MKIDIDIHTDDPNLRELCNLYWELSDGEAFTHKLKDIAELFDISTSRMRTLVNENCTAYSQKFSCSNCGAPRPFKSRTDVTSNQSYWSWNPWTCDTCKEILKEEQKRQAEINKQKKYDLVDAEYQDKRETGLDISNFTFSDAVYFIGLIRVGMSEDLDFIYPRESYERTLSPTRESDLEILSQLYRNNLICIHPGSRPDSVLLDAENLDAYKFYPLQVHWILPLSDGQTASDIIEQVEDALRSQDKWSAEWKKQSVTLRKEIALQESFEYLKFVLQEHGFEFSIGEKTTQIIKSLLNDFSVAQIYNLCWRASKDAAAYYMRESISKKKAANIVPGSIQRMAEKALSEGWDIKPYGRNFKVPQTMVSEVLYNMALQIGDAGFNAVIPKE